MEEDLDQDLLFGRHAVLAALREGRVRKLWLLRGPGRGPDEILRAARERGIVFQWVDRRRMAALVPGAAHQGVAARVSEHAYADLDEVLAKGRPSPLVALDGITDPGNLGALVRSAAFFGAAGVLVPRWRSAGLTGTVAKAAAGALEKVPLVQVANIANTLLDLRGRDYWVYGADAAGQACDRFPFAEPMVLVIGAEGQGLHRLVRERCHALVAVPGAGAMPSLNAACAATTLLYEIRRRTP